MDQRWWRWVVVTLFIVDPASGTADLTATERTWLDAAMPVLSHAREQRLPLDIIVQPQPTPGLTPLGMAWVDGRCKLVLSMRGNPEAQATLNRIPRPLVGPVVEAIAAHELGHCWRHLHRRWGSLPAGLPALPPGSEPAPDGIGLLTDIEPTRREEAYADLVGLAWTLRRHPARYAEVHAWHVEYRSDQARSAGSHDTRVWVRLAADPGRFAPAESIFDQVEPLWTAGMLAAD